LKKGVDMNKTELEEQYFNIQKQLFNKTYRRKYIYLKLKSINELKDKLEKEDTKLNSEIFDLELQSKKIISDNIEFDSEREREING